MAIGKRHLGKTDIEITPIGLGCWQFGPKAGFMSLYKQTSQDEADKIVQVALEGGINWFDTAEAYGKGTSERALSKALTSSGRNVGDVIIATKWFPIMQGFPYMPRTVRNLSKNCSKRQDCLTPYKIDLLQIHRPFALSSIETQMKAMAELVEAGKIRSVGISQFSAPQMQRCSEALAKYRIPLASNQVWINLLHRAPEKNGVLEMAKKLNVTLIAWWPLQSGLLTGKFHSNPDSYKKLPLMRRKMMGKIEKTRPLIKVLEDIAGSYKCSAAEVALSWLVNFYGDTVVAIPGATKTEHVKQNVRALNLKLTKQEMAKLDEVSKSIST